MPTVLTPRRTAAGLLAGGLVITAITGCSSDSSSGTTSASASSSSVPSANLTVLAAASLTDVFKTAGAAYEKDHPGTKVNFSFAGSQELAAQVKQGAPADVLVTADTKTMDGLKAETGDPRIIAKNRLVMVAGKDNPFKIASLKDLADSKIKVVLAAPEVPVGRYSQQVLAAQNVTVKPVSQEPNVRAVLSKVELGEADAGIVYATDAATAKDKVSTIDIPDDQNAVASYPAASLKASKNAAAADAFVAWLATPEAQKFLRDAGFQQP
ncbi:molybdate ABC transporter substrate-binding protein [Kitasatospora sp. NPDC096147]|uniref:molybdate ABC transporter substrate-binding protein n=1 Tax=Kitasatospora sp. NPDC096147 TaxID=3364093 RepID=UPI0038093F0A